MGIEGTKNTTVFPLTSSALGTHLQLFLLSEVSIYIGTSNDASSRSHRDENIAEPARELWKLICDNENVTFQV